MKKILVPVDFSECSDNALEFAIAISKKFNSELLILNSYYIPSSGAASIMRNLQEDLHKETVAQLDVLLKEKLSKHTGLNAKTYTDFNIPSTSIIRFVDHIDIDLVVMGTTGASGVKEIFMGSTTSAIIGKVTIPIFAVQKDSKLSELDKIVVSTDLVGLKDLKSMNNINKIATNLNLDVELLSIYTNMDEILVKQIEVKKERMDTVFGDKKYLMNLIQSYEVEETILNSISETDILAVVARSRGFFKKLFHSSMSKKLAMHSKNSILILHD